MAARRDLRSAAELLLAAAVVALMALLPLVYANDLMLFNFVMFLTLAQGLNIIYGFTGYLPFGYVGFFGAGAYGFALAVMHLHAPPLAALAIGAAAALVVAVVLIPMLRLSGAYFAIGNLAAAQAIYQIISNPAPGLSHMTFSKLPKETCEELVIPSGSLELSFHRAFGTLQLRQVESKSA